MAIIMFTISGGLFTTCKKPMPPIKINKENCRTPMLKFILWDS